MHHTRHINIHDLSDQLREGEQRLKALIQEQPCCECGGHSQSIDTKSSDAQIRARYRELKARHDLAVRTGYSFKRWRVGRNHSANSHHHLANKWIPINQPFVIRGKSGGLQHPSDMDFGDETELKGCTCWCDYKIEYFSECQRIRVEIDKTYVRINGYIDRLDEIYGDMKKSAEKIHQKYNIRVAGEISKAIIGYALPVTKLVKVFASAKKFKDIAKSKDTWEALLDVSMTTLSGWSEIEKLNNELRSDLRLDLRRFKLMEKAQLSNIQIDTKHINDMWEYLKENCPNHLTSPEKIYRS